MITVFAGPVKAGKSKRLVQIYEELSDFGNKCHIFSSRFSQNGGNLVESRYGISVKSKPINSIYDILPFVKIGDMIFIDEFQFLKNTKEEIEEFFNQNAVMYDFYIFGLERDYRNKCFDIFGTALCYADKVVKLHGNCEICETNNSKNSMRLLNNEPCNIDISEELIILDGHKLDENNKVEYKTVCEECWDREYNK